MRHTVALVGAAWCCCPAAGLAQDAPTTPPAVAAAESAAGQQGVLIYAPAFFASANPNTALDMIARLPGFALDIGAVDSRGLAGAAGNVLIDGSRPSSKSDTLDQVLGRITAASVERIELIRGGASGIDMQGRAVIANVVLKRSSTTEIVIEPNAYLYPDGFVGPLLKGSYAHRAGERQTELSFSATRDRTENTAQGTRVRTAPGGAPIQTAALDLRDHFTNFDVRGAIQRPVLGGKLHVNAVLGYFVSDDTQATTILAGAGANEFIAEHNGHPRGEFGFTWTRALGPRSTFELTGLQQLNRTTYRGDFASGTAGSAFTSGSTGGESVVRGVYTFRSSAALSLEGGGEVAYNFLKSDSAYTQNGAPVPLPNAAVLVSEVRGEGFVQATWHATDTLAAEAGVRVEVSRIAQSGDTVRSKSFLYPKPRMLLTWLPAAGHQFRLRFEQKVGQLDFGDFAASSEISLGTVAGGNADLKPQRSTLIEAVYERRFWQKGVLALTARHNWVQDVVDTIPLLGGFDATGNIGNGISDFAQAELTLPSDRLGLKNGLLKVRGSWTRSRVTDPLTGERRPFANQGAFGCGISFSQDLKGGRFSYGVDHGCDIDRASRYRTAEVRTYVNEPFVVVYGQWKPSAKLTVRIDWGNLIDAQTQTLRDVYAGPRAAAPIGFRENRSTRRGQYLFFQIRKVL